MAKKNSAVKLAPRPAAKRVIPVEGELVDAETGELETPEEGDVDESDAKFVNTLPDANDITLANTGDIAGMLARLSSAKDKDFHAHIDELIQMAPGDTVKGVFIALAKDGKYSSAVLATPHPVTGQPIKQKIRGSRALKARFLQIRAGTPVRVTLRKKSKTEGGRMFNDYIVEEMK